MRTKHGRMVEKLCKRPLDIVEEMTLKKAHLLHMVLGIAGEVGELVDAVKKNVIYDKPLDMNNIVEELGDLEFYLEGFRQKLEITREDTLQNNIEKLGKRYPGYDYSNQRAIDRADKQTPEERGHGVEGFRY